MEKSYATFDYSELPIIQIELTREAATDENFEEYLKETVAITSKTERYISLVDTTKGSYLSAKYRILQANYLEKIKNVSKNKLLLLFLSLLLFYTELF